MLIDLNYTFSMNKFSFKYRTLLLGQASHISHMLLVRLGFYYYRFAQNVQ